MYLDNIYNMDANHLSRILAEIQREKKLKRPTVGPPLGGDKITETMIHAVAAQTGRDPEELAKMADSIPECLTDEEKEKLAQGQFVQVSEEDDRLLLSLRNCRFVPFTALSASWTILRINSCLSQDEAQPVYLSGCAHCDLSVIDSVVSADGSHFHHVDVGTSMLPSALRGGIDLPQLFPADRSDEDMRYLPTRSGGTLFLNDTSVECLHVLGGMVALHTLPNELIMTHGSSLAVSYHSQLDLDRLSDVKASGILEILVTRSDEAYKQADELGRVLLKAGAIAVTLIKYATPMATDEPEVHLLAKNEIGTTDIRCLNQTNHAQAAV